jgi:hypothetical protein
MNFRSTARALALGTALLGLGTGLAQAQVSTTPPALLLPYQGTKEISLNGDISFNGNDTLQVGAGYGQFTDTHLEIGLQGNIFAAKHQKSDYSVGPFVNYHFPKVGSPLLPYVGVFAGYASNGGTDSASIGGQAGVKYFLNPGVAVYGQFQYNAVRHFSGQSDVVFGISTYFR